jgi:hypothetical protein
MKLVFPCAILMLAGACSGSEPMALPASGTLVVTTTTTGQPADSDGYSVSVDGGAGRPIASDGSLVVPDVAAGEHRLGLSGIAANCGVSGENPRDAAVAAEDTARVGFSLSCAAPAVDLWLTTRTSGPAADPDGYLLSLDGSPAQPIGAQATLRLPGLPPGSHAIALTGVADNCAVDGPNPISFLVSGAPAQLTFRVLCAGLTISTSTTGADPDLDGYLVSIDGNPPRPLGGNTTQELPLQPGEHELALSGLAKNCTLSGKSRRSVTVAAGAAAGAAFEVSCRPTVVGPAQLLYWGGPSGHIYRTDGLRTVDLTPGSDGVRGRWSPDRSKVVFETMRTGAVEIFVMNADGSAPSRIGRGSSPFWSPDGARIGFVREGLVTTKLDGSDFRRLTSDDSDDVPVWSPDGTRIAFQRRGACRLVWFLDVICAVDLYTIGPDGSGLVALTNLSAERAARQPAWSPDGRQLVYSFGPTLGLPRNLYILELATGVNRPLTTTTERWEYSPVWSRDGAEIAFADADADGIATILTIPSGGGPVTRIPTGEGPVYPSSWR